MVNNKKSNKYFFIFSFYRFINLKNKDSIKKKLDLYFQNKLMRGTILLADEGINGTISGTQIDLEKAIKIIKKFLNIRKLEIKVNKNKFLPFNKMKVRLKKEIVSFGEHHINIKNVGKYIEPKDWDEFINEKNIKLIDTRNIFEIKIGKFNSSINPKTKCFREFSKNFDKLKLNKNDNIAMYCTGGIRCEKASSYLKQIGYRNVSQLRGGIINYLEYKKNSRQPKKMQWKGECFVFDNRVTVNNDLDKGKFKQCFGCRVPLSKKDLKSKFYKKGVHCHHCVDTRSADQIKKSEMRQSQIETYDKISQNRV